MSNLIIRPIEARLSKEKFGGMKKMNPYCQITVGTHKSKSSVHQSGDKNPRWNDNLNFPMTGNNDIIIQILDDDGFQSHDVIHECHIHSSELPQSGSTRKWYPLKQGTFDKGGDILIEFEVERPNNFSQGGFQPVRSQDPGFNQGGFNQGFNQGGFQPINQPNFNNSNNNQQDGPPQLGTVVIKPKEAKIYKREFGFQRYNPYVVVSLKDFTQQTNVNQNGSTNPHWNDRLVFTINNSIEFKFEVKDNDGFGHHESIGQCENSMKDINPSGSVTKWFKLYKNGKEEGELQVQIEANLKQPTKEELEQAAKDMKEMNKAMDDMMGNMMGSMGGMFASFNNMHSQAFANSAFQQGGLQQQQPGSQQGGFPQMSGFPQMGGFPGFNQGGFQQQQPGSQQGGFPQMGGFPGFNQGGFPGFQ